MSFFFLQDVECSGRTLTGCASYFTPFSNLLSKYFSTSETACSTVILPAIETIVFGATCYTIYGYPSAYEKNGAFIIYTSTSPENALKAVHAIREEIDLLLEKGVSEQELEKGKQQLKTSLVLGQESTSAMMRTFGAHAVQTGQLYDFDTRISKIDQTTAEDVLRASREIFDFTNVCSSIVSRFDDIDIKNALLSE